MMKVTYRLKLGQDEFELNLDVKDEKELFEQLSFYSNLPKTAPGGATDLKIVFRTTTEGHKYYSLISESEKMEFKFGQNKENQGGGLFPKGWEPVYQKDASSSSTVIGAPVQTAPIQNAKPLTQTVKAATPVQAAPAPQTAPKSAAPPAPVNPQVSVVANDVLKRFGLNK